VLDAGAVKALSGGRASLLPAGITAVEGEFDAGDPVDLVGADRVPFARGLVTFSSDEIPTLIGRTTQELAAELGEGYDREVVHRDDLILLTP
jgi:glutamate 5-kinase